MRTPSGLRIDNPAFPLLQALISYWGTTDNDGNVTGTTIRCSGLATEPSYANHELKLLTGPAAGQNIEITTHPAGTDTATVRRAFTNVAGAAQQIASGTLFVILSRDSAIDAILTLLASIAGGTNWNPYGPRNVEVGNDITSGVTLYDPGGGIIPQADITEGTYTIERIRGGALAVIVGPVASSKADGLVFASYDFPVANWQVGDIFVFTFDGISIDIGGTITDLPPVQVYGRVVREADIQSIVTTIDTNVGAMNAAATADDLSDVTTTSAHAKLRRLLLRLSSDAFTATIQGAAHTELDTMLYQLATYISALGAAYSATVNPGGAARTNIEQTLEDLGDVLAGAGITTYPAAQPPGDGISIAEVLRQIYNDLVAADIEGATGIFHEQEDVAVSVDAILASETDILHLTAADTRYIVRSLRLKSADPNPNTVIVRLYELVNDGFVIVDSFDITNANFTTYHSLTDMFGLFALAGDELRVTVQVSAGGVIAVIGQYSYGKTNV